MQNQDFKKKYLPLNASLSWITRMDGTKTLFLRSLNCLVFRKSKQIIFRFLATARRIWRRISVFTLTGRWVVIHTYNNSDNKMLLLQVFNEHPAFRLASDGCLRALAMHFTMTHRSDLIDDRWLTTCSAYFCSSVAGETAKVSPLSMVWLRFGWFWNFSSLVFTENSS